jgi:FtsP/CotA-like multicopper oxidase with cupredoxin domain
VIKVEPGGRVLLRVINGSSMSNFHLDLGALDGELIAVDGFRVQPVTARRFPIAVAQRLDIRLAMPPEATAYPVLAISGGRHGSNRHRAGSWRRDSFAHPRYGGGTISRTVSGSGAQTAGRHAPD